MRERMMELILAGALASAPLVLHAAPAATPAPPPSAAPAAAAAARQPGVASSDPQTVLAFYPPAARAAGIEGEAVIRCSRNEHLRLLRCSLISETPAGQGFGAAALAMAAQSQDNPKINQPELLSAASVDQAVKFTLHPPDIDPDITRMAHSMTGPTLITEPTRAQIQAAYPVRALSDQVRGGAAMVCTVTETGHLQDCHVAAELPSGYGFGQAAVDLAGDFLLKPALLDGEPVGGRQVRVAVAFTTDDPDAPLTLQTAPAAGAKDKPADSNGGLDAGPAQPPPPYRQ
jgi:hypothetical protein